VIDLNPTTTKWLTKKKETALLQLNWPLILAEKHLHIIKSKFQREILRVDLHKYSEITELKTKTVYLKIFHPTTFIEKTAHRLNITKAKHEFSILSKLNKNNIPCPNPIAHGIAYYKQTPLASILILDSLPSSMTLGDFLKTSNDTNLRKIALGLYGQLIAKLHRLNWHVKDLYMDNVIVLPTDLNKIWSIDHEATKKRFFLSKQNKLQSLVAAIHSNANPELTEEETKTILESYLQQQYKFNNKPYTEQDASFLLQAINLEDKKIQSKRLARLNKLPFKRAKQLGNFIIIRHRLLEGHRLIELYKLAIDESARTQNKELTIKHENTTYKIYFEKFNIKLKFFKLFPNMKIFQLRKFLIGYIEDKETKQGLTISIYAKSRDEYRL
jgi:tRNA A-37 threonylcarbamoyl transferase component Bud32